MSITVDDTVEKGGEDVLLIRNEDDTLWEMVGGIKSTNFTISNPTEDTTNQATTGSFATKEFTGYSDVSINASGVYLKSVAGLDPVTGLGIASVERMETIATSGNRSAIMAIRNAKTGKGWQGAWNIESFESAGEKNSAGQCDYYLPV